MAELAEPHMLHVIALRSDVERSPTRPVRTVVAGWHSVLLVGLVVIAGFAGSATGVGAQGHVGRASDGDFPQDVPDRRAQAEVPAAPAGGTSDRAALEALYHATGGANWKNRTNWLSDASLDHWYGVSTDDSGRVTGLELYGNNLTGTIPPELGRLANLTQLALRGNNLTGTIPPELGRLANLARLNLMENQLNGAIPAELGRLMNLDGLFLGGNSLTGALPRNLMDLPDLELLYFSGMDVCVPADAAFQAWVASLPLVYSSGHTCEGLLVSFTPAWYTVAEGGTVPVTVHLSAAEMPGRAVTIPVTSAGRGGATAADYAGVPATVTFGPTDTTRTFLFEARADANPDDGETVTLGLGEALPPGVTPGNPMAATVTLHDYDRVARDREALVTLYHATEGPNWSSRANWLSDQPLSTWAGVRTNLDGRVTRLALDRNQLRGELPAALGNLTALESLAMDRNQLSGAIPAELGNLTKLQHLYLWDNQLTGPIPPELGNLSNLEWLTLRSNQLTGSIPPALGNLGSLVTLSLWDNQLTGPIPGELGDLAGLVRLYLNDNRLHGGVPDTLGGLTHLEHLYLRGNPLSGPLPQSLMQLSGLERLVIDDTGLCVPADAAFGAWLAAIPDFTSSGFTCEVPATVAFGSARYTVAEGESVPVTVRLSHPRGRAVTIALTAKPGGGATSVDYAGVPSSVTFGPADAVRSFRVEARADAEPETGETVTVGIGSPLPAGVVSATPATAAVTLVDAADGGAQDRAALEAFYQATGGASWKDNTNWLSEAPLDQWAGVKTDDRGRVIELDLSSNNLTGVTPRELGTLTDLQRLDLKINELTGVIPSELGALTGLQVLDLGYNELTGAIPPELGRLTDLEALALGSNQLGGAIPAALGHLANLRGLWLDHNQLSGAIPSALGGLANLEHLVLYRNELTGVIPAELGRLTNLRGLWLDHNQLSGAIPPVLGGLANLEGLGLDRNQLTGVIPAELGRLANLKSLSLASNHLSGAVAPELGDLANLEVLDLAFNVDLSGPLPVRLRMPMNYVDLHFTRVCAPAADAVFEAWAATATFYPSGLTCDAAVPAVSAIDLAVFYTAAARRAAGGRAAIEAEIDLMVAETNQAYRDSGVTQRVVLTAREEVQYVEADYYADVTRLMDREDGHMDEVHAIRDRVGADLVHLISSAAYGVCGVAAAVGSRADSAFGLTAQGCGGSTFAHELGHNMGLQHDRYAACGGYACNNWPTPYSYGYVNQRAFGVGRSRGSHWFTIMAYWWQCEDDIGRVCSEILRFSNPSQTWNGDPLGVPGDRPSHRIDGPSDAVRLLNNSRHVIASFRDPAANRPAMSEGMLRDWTLEVGSAVAVELAGAFWDPDGDALTFGATSSEPSVAAVTVSGSTLTVTAVSPGAASATVTATDAGGSNGTAAQSFTVTVASGNRAPEAVGVLPPVTVGTDEGPVSVDVSAAFRDPDGDALTYGAASSAPSVAAVAVSGSVLTVTAVSPGTASVAVTATDVGGSNGTAAQSFTVTVASGNRAPEAVGVLPPVTVGADEGPVSVDVSAAFRDPDGDALTYGATSSAPSVAAVAVSGSVLTVTAVSPGTASVTVTATDAGGSNGTAAQSFTVTVPSGNGAPEAVGVLPPVTVGTDEGPVSVDVSAAFRDPDGDALTYGATSSAPSVAAVAVSGSVLTVTAVSPGTASVAVTATDAGGSNGTAAQSFTVTVPRSFTDHPIVPGETPVRAVHFTELRTRIDALRGAAGLPPFGWTDPVLTAGATPVRLVHLLELRAALAEASTVAGGAAPGWTDAAPTGGTTPIRAVHLMELRAAVLALE